MDSKAYEKMNYGLALLGAAAGGKRHGCVEAGRSRPLPHLR